MAKAKKAAKKAATKKAAKPAKKGAKKIKAQFGPGTKGVKIN